MATTGTFQITAQTSGDGATGTFNATGDAVALSGSMHLGTLALSTSYAALPYFGITAPKAIVILNESAIAVVVSLNSGTTDHLTIAAAPSIPLCIPTPGDNVQVKSASGTPSISYAIIK